MVKKVEKKAEKKKLSVFEISYETSEFNFKVNIAAWSREDAFGYLSKMLGKTAYKINEFTSKTSIDAITTQVIDDIIKTTTNPVEFITKKESALDSKSEDDYKTSKSSMKKK